MKTLIALSTTLLTILPLGLSAPADTSSENPRRRTDLSTRIIEQGNAPWSLQRISSVAPVTQNGRPATDMTYKYRYDERDNASGVDVYVLDGGVNMLHPDFGGRAKVIFAANRADLWDNNGHGTHVAGIIGSLHYGVAKNASIFALRIDSNPPLDAPSGGYDTPPPEHINDIVAAMLTVVQQHNYRKKTNKDFKGSVMNLSWGFPPVYMDMVPNGHMILKAALKNATDAGIHITIAPDNSNSDACNHFPSGYVQDLPTLFVVGSSDIMDRRANNSDWGSCIDIHAPGVDIMSTSIPQLGDAVANSGTSMAAPLVAGVIATQLAKYPDLRLNPAEMKKHILGMAQKWVVKGAEKGGNFLLNTGMGENPMEAFVN
ncbi:hypothetical protein H072_7775 [Dactylellina haptotyla CBS 200.50]|uniref:Peptidase S8/S53 domain-containing protein n=1 Tax=Dactylellina haptotyla (strain CBS 200.50) TaxID=1284197 RepID=S8ABJ5_DACHA|nr:hypothetical protein H072_7775 [Dactylellina haptotyla CBS 200.50]